MEKKTKNSTAIIGLDKGFIQTPKNVITNANLTDSAVRLFQLIMDTPSDKRVSLEYYRDLLGWSKNKLANAKKSLEDNGYLKTIQHPKGIGNGFSYNYVISSFGNLKNEADVKTTEELEEIIESPESNLIEETPTASNEIETTSEIDFDDYLDTLHDLINYYREEFIMEAMPFVENRDINGLKRLTSKYLKQFYNAEIAKVKNPDSNKKAFEALKDWLKDEVFSKKNLLKLYTVNNGNINARFLMYKDKYRINRPVDFETEMGDYLENPRD